MLTETRDYKTPVAVGDLTLLWMITGNQPNLVVFFLFLADFFYSEAVPNSQLLHHVFCVSIILILYLSVSARDVIG